jgi:oligopeptide/dipeptide ABC transporter ATP-binding protein
VLESAVTHVVPPAAASVAATAPLLQVSALRKVFPLARQDGGGSWLDRLRPGAAKAVPLLHAVDDVDLAIMSGETVGLVGESGCGKSTLVRLIARLADPTSGSVQLEGRDITSIPAHAFATLPERGRIQMVFQDPTDSLNPRFTAFDAIADPLRRMQHPRATETRSRVQEAAGMVGLAPELLSRFPHQLSGGQKARVGIARAIVVRPQLLLLDEPTSAVDVSVQALILQLLDRLRQQLGMSYLFVSHDLGIVRLLCDRIAVMYMGKIVETGATEQVFRQPAHPYTRMLLAAVPSLKRRHDTGAAQIVGEPGSPVDPPPRVCRFAGRCPIAVDRCHAQAPALREIGQHHSVACHLAEPRASG